MSPLKNLIKHIVYAFRDLWLPKNSGINKEKSLVILRMDAIGDYILFRNFIEAIKTSEKYKDHSITLIGNEIWKDIAIELDSQWINRFIWINPIKFQKDFAYRKEILMAVEDSTYDLLFHPTYSRDYYVAETLAKHIHAKLKIASNGDLMNIANWQKKRTNKIYAHLIEIDKLSRFEFELNKAIVDAFTGEKSSFKRPFIDASKLPVFAEDLSSYIILFIGGGAEFRKWTSANWKELIALLLKNYKGKLIISGGPNDKEKAAVIYSGFNMDARVLNYCGRTNLLELLSLISRADGMISNETSAAHMAVALDIPVIVISNGHHYGRFNPYPRSISSKYVALYPKEIESEKDEKIRLKKYGQASKLNINTISASSVLNLSKSFIKP